MFSFLAAKYSTDNQECPANKDSKIEDTYTVEEEAPQSSYPPLFRYVSFPVEMSAKPTQGGPLPTPQSTMRESVNRKRERNGTQEKGVLWFWRWWKPKKRTKEARVEVDKSARSEDNVCTDMQMETPEDQVLNFSRVTRSPSTQCGSGQTRQCQAVQSLPSPLVSEYSSSMEGEKWRDTSVSVSVSDCQCQHPSLSVSVNVSIRVCQYQYQCLCLSISVSVSVSVVVCKCLSVSVSVSFCHCQYQGMCLCLSVSVGVFVSISLGVSHCLCPSVSASFNISVCQYQCLCLSVYGNVVSGSFWQCQCLSVSVPVSGSVSVCRCQCQCLSVSVSVSVSLSILRGTVMRYACAFLKQNFAVDKKQVMLQIKINNLCKENAHP